MNNKSCAAFSCVFLQVLHFLHVLCFFFFLLQQKMEEVRLEKEELLKSMELLQKERDDLLEERDRIQKEVEQERESTVQLRKEVQVRGGKSWWNLCIKIT